MRRSRWAGAGLACSLLAYVLLALPLFDVPLRGDETIWPPEAAAIAESGVPKNEFDDMSLVVDPSSFVGGYGADYGVWHPPTYEYVLALPTAVLADGSAGRLVGLLCGLVTLVLVFSLALLAARRSGLDHMWPVGAATAAALALGTSPYWVHYSVFLDIDTSIYPIASAAGLYLVARGPRFRRLVPLTGLLLALHWVKLTAFGFVAGGLTVHQLLMQRYRHAARSAVAGAAATAAFAATWLIYAQLTGVPAGFMPEFLRSDKGGAGEIGSVFTIANTARSLVAGTGFPLTLLVLVGGVAYARRLARREVQEHDVFFVVGFLTVATYVLLFPYPGKYVVPALPLLAAHGTVEAVRNVASRVGRRRPTDALAIATLAVGLFAYQLWVVGDMITGPEYRDPSTRNFGDAFDDPRLGKYLLALLPLVLVALYGRRVLRSGAAAVAAAALAGVVPINVAETLATRDHQETSVIPQRERGFDGVVAWLGANAPPGARVMADADVALHRPELRVVPEDRAFYYPGERLTEALREPSLLYVVVAKGRGPADTGFGETLARSFRPVAIRGSFVIYARR